jgi:sphingolipid delta-4 desaturase
MTADEPTNEVNHLYDSHAQRARAIYRSHPEIKTCFGPNRLSFVCIVAITALQFALAKFSADRPWWLILPLAYFVGAVLSHALFVLIHDCCHGLVFRRTILNRFAEIVANFPLAIPCAASFGQAHREHHRSLGEYPDDVDIASDWEARWVGRSPWRKLFWLGIYPIWLLLRSLRPQKSGGIDRWIAINILVQIGVDAVLLWLWGPWAVVYLVLSTWFSVTLHPLGARWIQEHYMVAPPQRTYSYYGPLNLVAFNIGYHNEHHDFPGAAWNRLPRIRRIGGAWYDRLIAHRSLTALMLRFVFLRSFHLHRRMNPAIDVEQAGGD